MNKDQVTISRPQIVNPDIKTKSWNQAEIDLLKVWGEIAASSRVIHDKSYRKFKKMNYWFTIPAIILNSLLGLATYARTSFPVDHRDSTVPLAIGAMNVGISVSTAISQFLKIAERQSEHNNASQSYGELARTILTELKLPPHERGYSGSEMIAIAKAELDRLIKQSPSMPLKILNSFEKDKRYEHLARPDLLYFDNIQEYQMTEEELRDNKLTDIILQTTQRFNDLKDRASRLRSAESLRGMDKLNSDTLQNDIENLEKHGIVSALLDEKDKEAVKYIKKNSDKLTHNGRQLKIMKSKFMDNIPITISLSKKHKRKTRARSTSMTPGQSITCYEDKYSDDSNTDKSVDRNISDFADQSRVENRIGRQYDSRLQGLENKLHELERSKHDQNIQMQILNNTLSTRTTMSSTSTQPRIKSKKDQEFKPTTILAVDVPSDFIDASDTTDTSNENSKHTGKMPSDVHSDETQTDKTHSDETHSNETHSDETHSDETKSINKNTHVFSEDTVNPDTDESPEQNINDATSKEDGNNSDNNNAN
jgi:hypothetical protein